MRADFLDGIDIAGFPRQQFARGAMVVGPDAGAGRVAYVAAGGVRNPASGARIGPGGVLALPEFLAESAARAPTSRRSAPGSPARSSCHCTPGCSRR